ncbi:MAG: globin [Sulfuricurvum sp.]|nr:globin [Sulfuricurvum sp.]
MTQIMDESKLSLEKNRALLNHHESMYPEVLYPSHRLYMIWGADKIRQMVRYHHNLLRLCGIENFLPFEDDLFEFATKKTADFFVDILSRGKYSLPIVGCPSLRMRYFQITVDEKAREVWLAMYKKAINDLSMPSECIEEFWNWIEPLSIWMINRRNFSIEITRYPYSSIWTDFVDFKYLSRCG